MWKIYVHWCYGSSIWKNRILFAINFTIHVSIFRFVSTVEIVQKLNQYNFALFFYFVVYSAMISYNVVVGDTISKVLVRFIPSLGSSMGSVRFFVVFLVTLVSCIKIN